MNERKNQDVSVDELPDRIAHRRKIAKRIALDTPEYAADDPSSSRADTPAGRLPCARTRGYWFGAADRMLAAWRVLTQQMLSPRSQQVTPDRPPLDACRHG